MCFNLRGRGPQAARGSSDGVPGCGPQVVVQMDHNEVKVIGQGSCRLTFGMTLSVLVIDLW